MNLIVKNNIDYLSRCQDKPELEDISPSFDLDRLDTLEKEESPMPFRRVNTLLKESEFNLNHIPEEFDLTLYR